MRTILIIVPCLFLLAAAPAFGSRLHPEKYYQENFCEKAGGMTEYVLPDRARVDCLTKDYAIEVDFASKWAEAAGQALYYSLCTLKKPGVLLIMEDENDYRHLERLKAVSRQYGITIWTVGPEGAGPALPD